MKEDFINKLLGRGSEIKGVLYLRDYFQVIMNILGWVSDWFSSQENCYLRAGPELSRSAFVPSNSFEFYTVGVATWDLLSPVLEFLLAELVFMIWMPEFEVSWFQWGICTYGLLALK
jgi:hypothetical protein